MVRGDDRLDACRPLARPARGVTAFELSVTEPGEHARRIRLEACDGDALVGVAELELDLPVPACVVDPAYDVRVADGVLGGYSLLFVPHGETYAWQDDTLVMPVHRGSGLGAALKTANYADLPGDVEEVHTWTAPSNGAMHHTNTALGFRVVERMREMEVAL